MIQTLANQGVDAIQTAKKQFVNTFVYNDQLKSILHNFVDAQSEYTKSAIDAGVKATMGTIKVATDSNQFADSFTKFQSYFDKFSTAKKSK